MTTLATITASTNSARGTSRLDKRARGSAHGPCAVGGKAATAKFPGKSERGEQKQGGNGNGGRAVQQQADPGIYLMNFLPPFVIKNSGSDKAAREEQNEKSDGNNQRSLAAVMGEGSARSFMTYESYQGA